MAEPEPVAIETFDGASEAQNGSALVDNDYEVELTLADQQLDPDSPLFSVQTFEELKLKPEILKGLINMNFRAPSKVQTRALPLLINSNTNLIGQSQSGTGKTMAFVLNILQKIDLSTPQPQALILAPTRELARQIQGVVRQAGEFLEGLKVTEAIPDPTKRGQIYDGQVIVGTPGTTFELIRRKYLDSKGMKVLVLDEADNMLDQAGLADQSKRVKAVLPRDVQTVLFSATFPEYVLDFAKQFCPNANVFTLKATELTVDGIKQFFFDCDGEEQKYSTLLQFYGLMVVNSSIIFVKRRDTAAEIERRMKADHHEVAHLSGALEGKDRDAVIDRFRNGEAKVLITTNVLARGIDVSTVTLVINYDIPTHTARGIADPETYLHRIGRTGRFGRVGVAVTFVSSQQEWAQLKEIENTLHTTIEPLDANDFDSVEEKLKAAMKSAKKGKKKTEAVAA